MIINKYIVSACIYTYNKQKYFYLLTKYNIIKGIYSERDDVVEYIKKNKSKDNIRYKQGQLITYYEYKDKYIDFHKIISMQYGKIVSKIIFFNSIKYLTGILIIR